MRGVIVLLCSCFVLSSQIPSTQNSAKPSEKSQIYRTENLDSKFKNMANEISPGAPPEKRELLMQNALTVQSKDKELRQYFSHSGLKNESVDHIELHAWRELTGKEGNKKFAADEFQAFAEAHYGGLRIESTPDGAYASVNNDPWGKTVVENGTQVGTKHVTLHLDCYEEAAGDVEVKAGQMATFAKTLKKKKC